MPKPQPITANAWPATADAATRRRWGEAGWSFPEFGKQAGRDVVVRTVEEVRAAGVDGLIKWRYPDFAIRAAAVAELAAGVAPHLAKRGELTDGEYDGLIRAPMFRALPFLDAAVRQALARELVALHAAQTP